MSIRNINKDHLKEHAGVELVTHELLTLPEHEDPLKFWTHHETEPTLVDLTVFAEGELRKPRAAGKWAGPFSGRSKLIHQLAPAIEAVCFGCTARTVGQQTNSLRAWWRLFDTVEQAAAQVGQPMDRVEDVCQLTHVYLDFVYRSGMRRTMFYMFYSVANAIRKQLGTPELHWKAPEDPEPKRHLPPDDQIKALRIALKQEWETVRRRWALEDRIRADRFEPQTDQESNLLRHWQHFAQVQSSSGKASPSTDELHGGTYKNAFAASTRLGISEMRKFALPSRREADTAFHLCLANTGWNPAVLNSLDISQPFLRNHPRDPSRYLLTGEKARAGGKEQPVSGLWKTTAGPGFIIKVWMDRIAPLRDQLQATLVAEREKYAQMRQDGALADEITRKLINIKKLEVGCRRVWLFVNRHGEIDWLDPGYPKGLSLNGKLVSYLTVIRDRLNRERVARSEPLIPPVTPADFRDMFALFVWRMTGGNIFALMRALNHARMSTTQLYTDNNILNAERDHQVITFINHLFAELGVGRVDITILAHLQRYGAVTKEMEQRLDDYRAQQRSRMGVACKDPFHPPTEIQPVSPNNRICGPQRCLLCKTHAVILPESMSGVAMRVEELETMQAALSVGIWHESRFPEELRNGLDVLKLFAPEEVRNAREHWAQAIATGSHHIPGLHQASNSRDEA